MSDWAGDLRGQDLALRTLDRLVRQGGPGRFVMLHGPMGVGKGTAARRLTARLLRPDAPPGRFDPETHPDVALLVPDKEGGSIKVDDVRTHAASAPYPPLKGAVRVWLIDPLDALTSGAANALLRLLEEPPQHLWILGVAHNLSMVAMTLRSRALKVPFLALQPQDLAAIMGSDDPAVTHAGTVARAALISDPQFLVQRRAFEAMLDARFYDPQAPADFIKKMSGYAGGLGGFLTALVSASDVAAVAARVGPEYDEGARRALIGMLEQRRVLLDAIADLEANVNPNLVCEHVVRTLRQVRKAWS